MVETVQNKQHDAEAMAAASDSQQDMKERRGQASRGNTGKTGTAGSGFNKGSRAKQSTDKLSSSQRGAQNIVIDIESEDLTYNQARSIRLQIQRDVEQLRNRVRML